MNDYEQRILNIVQQKPQLIALQAEDVLDLTLAPVLYNTARLQIADCLEYFKVRDLDNDLTYRIDDIKLRSFDFLFDEANKKIIYGLNYVTALEISFGIIAGTNNITPIYTPLYLQRINPVPPSPNNYQIINRCGDFIYDGTDFQPASPAQLLYKNTYKTDILIKHLGDNDPTAFRLNIDNTSVIFPFQTIYALEHDNAGISELWLYNSVRKSPVAGGDNINHAILLSPELRGEPLFAGKFANRGHLCPPDCSTLHYIRA